MVLDNVRVIGMLVLGLGFQPRAGVQPGCGCGKPEAAEANRQALEAHSTRCLDEASAAYKRALLADPPRKPSEAEIQMVLKFAPRLYVTPNEPFALRDVAAIIHPEAPWIAYHFLWEDDIDFPDDNDPCDHELMWVRLDDKRQRVVDYFTYFHERILRGTASAVEEANRSGGRPTVYVQWGKHGSMPAGWRDLTIVADSDDSESEYYPKDQPITLERYNRGTFEKLSTVGRRASDSPLGRLWPLKFGGSWEDFINFSKFVEPRQLLKERNLILTSCWNNAVLDLYFLPYNFRAKTEWPEVETLRAGCP